MSYNNNTPIVGHIITTYKLICICIFFSLFIYDLLLAYIKEPPFEPDSPFAGYAPPPPPPPPPTPMSIGL